MPYSKFCLRLLGKTLSGITDPSVAQHCLLSTGFMHQCQQWNSEEWAHTAMEISLIAMERVPRMPQWPLEGNNVINHRLQHLLSLNAVIVIAVKEFKKLFGSLKTLFTCSLKDTQLCVCTSQ